MKGEGQAGVWLPRIFHSLFQISLFYFSVHEFLSARMYGHHASAWFPWRSEEGSGTLELESQMIVNHQGSTGDCGPFGRGVMAPSQISRPATLFCKMVGVSHWTRVSWARMTGLFVQCLPALESKWASPPLAFMLVLGSKHRSVWLQGKRFIESSLQPQLNYVDISKYFKVSRENICMCSC